jgi:hypothetical protein
MRLLLGFAIAVVWFTVLGPAALADYVTYYAIVSCDPQQHSASIELGEAMSEPVPAEPQYNPDESGPKSFYLEGGEVPEDCHLAPDVVLRAKVGEGRAMPYGQCGADPAVWVSVWVNKRKWLSRFQIAGSCTPNVLSEITVTPEQIKSCTWPDPELNGGNRGPETCTIKAAAALPDHVDTDEYPIDPNAPAPGTVAVVYSENSELCDSMITESEQVEVPKDVEGKLFSDYQGGLYGASGGFTRDVFDIDNSGTPRTVYGFHPSNHANDADMYFSSPGDAVDQAWPQISEQMLYDGSAYIFPLSFGKCGDHPCRRGDEPEEGTIGFRHYPMEVRFRYLHETPFVWRGATYFLLNSMDMEAENIYAVLKPNPKGFDETCILNKVPEPF